MREEAERKQGGTSTIVEVEAELVKQVVMEAARVAKENESIDKSTNEEDVRKIIMCAGKGASKGARARDLSAAEAIRSSCPSATSVPLLWQALHMGGRLWEKEKDGRMHRF